MSFTAPTRLRSAPILPLAAMVDILFLLLVFFMTAAAFRDQDRIIEVSLPGTASTLAPETVAPLIISVDAEGRTYIGDQAYDLEELEARLRKLASRHPDLPVGIRGDQQCPHGRIVRVLDAVRVAGLPNASIHTRVVRRGQEP